MIQAHLFGDLHEHIDEQVEIGGAGSGNRRHRIDVGFRGNLDDRAGRRDDIARCAQLLHARPRVGVHARDAETQQRRLVRHGPHDGKAAAEPRVDIAAAHAGRDRNDERLRLLHCGCEGPADRVQDLRLDRQEHALSLAHDRFVVRLDDRTGQLGGEGRALRGQRFGDQDVARLVASGEHSARQCPGHIAAAYKSHFSVVHLLSAPQLR